jgi:hypothetical protein
VLNLRKRFMDRHAADYVFRPVYHKRIPADGFAPYMSNIWVMQSLHVFLIAPG